MLPPLPTLEIHDTQAAERLQEGLDLLLPSYWPQKKAESVQVATPLTVIGKEAQGVFSIFSDWEHKGNNAKIQLYWPSSNSTANHARISHSNGTGSGLSGHEDCVILG